MVRTIDKSHEQHFVLDICVGWNVVNGSGDPTPAPVSCTTNNRFITGLLYEDCADHRQLVQAAAISEKEYPSLELD